MLNNVSISELENKKFDQSRIVSSHQESFNDGIQEAIEQIKEAEVKEPVKELVAIPDYVGEWITQCKGRGITLYGAFHQARQIGGRVHDWIWDGSGSKPSEVFARAWLDGFTIEKKSGFLITIVDEADPCSSSAHMVTREEGNRIVSIIKEEEK